MGTKEEHLCRETNSGGGGRECLSPSEEQATQARKGGPSSGLGGPGVKLLPVSRVTLTG